MGVRAAARPWKMDGSAGNLTCREGECKVGRAYELASDRPGRLRGAWREDMAPFHDIDAVRPPFPTQRSFRIHDLTCVDRSKRLVGGGNSVTVGAIERSPT